MCSAAIRPEIISFINAHPRFLWFEFDGQEKMAITPRTWENFSRIIDNNADVATIEDVVMMLGPVALDGASATFTSFSDSFNLLRQPEDPDAAYPTGHYLPIPLVLATFSPTSDLTVSLTVP